MRPEIYFLNGRSFTPAPKEIPDNEGNQEHGAHNHDDLGLIHLHVAGSVKDLSRRLFVRTDTLDSDIAALAITGDSSQPVTGYSSPAAIGIPITL
jgi:hypothetical protein